MSKTLDNETFVSYVQTDLKTRGHYTGKVDGWAGEKTAEAYRKALPPPASETAQGSNSAKLEIVGGNSVKLYAHAWKDAGLRETSGAASTPRILQAIKEAAGWLNGDDSQTAWCGCIMGLWCKELGLPVPPEYYRAASWLEIGETVEIGQAVKGDVVVLSRSGGNHVALYHSHDNTHITLLGGNQSNSVNLTRYSLGSLKGIRRL